MKEFKDRYKLNNKEHKNTFSFKELLFITAIFGFVVCGLTTLIVFNITKSYAFDKNLNDIVKSYNEITNTYYKDVDTKDLADSAIDGMLEYLDENYSKYLDTKETESLNDSLSDSYKGIGIVVYNNGENYVVYSVVKNSESDRAGIKKNDIIKSINGVTITKDMETSELTGMINKSSKVNIVVIREEKELSFDIEVKNVSIPVVSSKTLSKNNKKIGYIYLSSFTKNIYNQFKDALEELEHDNIDSLIIDLRDNTGGYLSGVQEISDLFIKKDKVLYSLEYKDSTKVIKTKTDDYKTYPIVVLVNEYTASASEVLTLALKESYGATVIGTKTFGKGKVQVTSTLSDDTMIKYTTAKWYSPNNNNIDEIGIKPGITVKQSLDFILTKDSNDLQLEKALDYITK
ncbi:MAG: S41 family peptidase [Bacilli bacterium]|nr:S41 family peptidase [Bacilli bacterium]